MSAVVVPPKAQVTPSMFKANLLFAPKPDPETEMVERAVPELFTVFVAKYTEPVVILPLASVTVTETVEAAFAKNV